MALIPGTRIGSYEITGLIGIGGMGEVYRAHDTRLGRDVALKVLPVDVASDAERLARFEREARAVAALNHPNIVTLHSIENEAGVRFLTMELVEGKGLDAHLTPGGLPIERVLDVGIAIADALAAAHDKGMVHRDLKPANVMLTHDGRVKVLDFGLAKPAQTGGAASSAETVTTTAPMSVAGQVLGTVPYMAPEQVRGEVVDPRTDLFALGTLLYELTCGRRPFGGATLGVISSAILTEKPAPVASVRADVPPDLARIIARCLEKDPGVRFQTARDLVSELRRVGLARDAGATIFKPPPVPATPLIGREEMLDQAAARLREGVRLLTVDGYGGTGKTRFAIELFRRLAREYAGGAAFVSLASVTVAADVLPTVAATLAIPEAHGRSALEALATVIGDRRVLLVLDNLEQVLDAAGDIAALLSRCPALQGLATSRAPLKIGAETEFSLPPLELPPPDATPETIGHCPAVALFVQRARKVKPDFALTGGNAAVIADICRRLDGLPLAIELAAARARILEPAALLRRLDQALDLLTSGDRDLPLRQRTLRATISWSYSLLDNTEQGLLRRLSCFHEGWTLEAMERVCYPPEERHRALDALDALVEKGLVRVVGASGRYALLETIRAFAAEQLHAAGEVDATRQAHADYFTDFAAGVAAGLRTTDQLEAMRRALADDANTHAAVEWLIAGAAAGDADALEQGLLLCGYLDWVWHINGQHVTGRVALDQLLALAADRPASRGRALAFLAAGMVSTTTDEWERSLTEWRRGFEDGEAVGDREAAAEGVMGVGYCTLSMGRMADAEAALDDAIARSRGVSDFLLAVSMTMKGMLLFATGNLEAGMALVRDARRIQVRIGDHEGGGVALSFLAQMTFAKGDLTGALSIYADALASFEALGDRPETARVLCEMGWTALAAADSRSARRSFRRAVQAYEEVGSARGTGLALLGIAASEAADGRSERAVAIAAAAQALSARAGVVVEHPMDPGVLERIEALKASIPKGTLDGLVADASTLTPAAVLAME